MRLRLTVAISNALCELAGRLGERGHDRADAQVIRLRAWLDRTFCRLAGHPRIVYGPVRDICLDCLSIVDEHPNGRGRPT